MALLTLQIGTLGQQFEIARPVGRMTIHAVLAGRWVLPKKWAAFLRVTAVARIVSCCFQKHLVALSAMRVVTRRAADFHVAVLGTDQMARPLEYSLANAGVAAKACLLYRSIC